MAWKDPLYQAYYHQQKNAERRGIKFRLTFEQWRAVWQGSGKLPLRGRGQGKYCMARFGDKGAYEVGNVSIILFDRNSRDMRHTPAARKAIGIASSAMPRTKAHRKAIGLAMVGRRFSDESRRKMSVAAKNRRKANG